MPVVSAEIAEAALRVLLQASSALQPADLSATLTHCARLDMKDDIRGFARSFTAQARTGANPAVPALAAMLADNQELAHACFEASGIVSDAFFASVIAHHTSCMFSITDICD